MNKPIFFDIECYPNYFLICFKTLNGESSVFELSSFNHTFKIKNLYEILESHICIGFNSSRYDLPMIAGVLANFDNVKLKQLSDKLILETKEEENDIDEDKLMYWDILRQYNIWIPQINHIDLIKSLPKPYASLKMYGARLHVEKLQDLPFDPNQNVDLKQIEQLKNYCFNDVDITIVLYNYVKDILLIRSDISTMYNTDVRSKTNAKIAQTLILKEMGYIPKPSININTIYKYKLPANLAFHSQELQNLVFSIEAAEFTCGKDGKLSKFIYKLNYKDREYTVGIGGLHSTGQKLATHFLDGKTIIDFDVISYYPSLILNHDFRGDLKELFINAYKKFYEDRLLAKKTGNKVKSEIYKLVLNNTFGNFGCKHSLLYSPQTMLNITLTGQLSLLMLIEMVSNICDVISANTDGITVQVISSKVVELKQIVSDWEAKTNLILEETIYKSLYQESVNSYIAIKEGKDIGKDTAYKGKGMFADKSLSKNPALVVCIEAVVNYLTKGTPIIETIYACKNDITKFLIIKKVGGGAMYKGQYLGKVVRWYYGFDGDIITYANNGNKVGNSDGAIPLQTLPKTPIEDININVYVNKCYEILTKMGIKDEFTTNFIRKQIDKSPVQLDIFR